MKYNKTTSPHFFAQLIDNQEIKYYIEFHTISLNCIINVPIRRTFINAKLLIINNLAFLFSKITQLLPNLLP